jgi:hypothetical protein
MHLFQFGDGHFTQNTYFLWNTGKSYNHNKVSEKNENTSPNEMLFLIIILGVLWKWLLNLFLWLNNQYQQIR